MGWEGYEHQNEIEKKRKGQPFYQDTHNHQDLKLLLIFIRMQSPEKRNCSKNLACLDDYKQHFS